MNPYREPDLPPPCTHSKESVEVLFDPSLYEPKNILYFTCLDCGSIRDTEEKRQASKIDLFLDIAKVAVSFCLFLLVLYLAIHMETI